MQTGVAVFLAVPAAGALAQQIENGAPADLFAAASPEYPKRLAAEGLRENPIAFASNKSAALAERAHYDRRGRRSRR
jgi:ABC-type molybdate transport system substrate-binding protein